MPSTNTPALEEVVQLVSQGGEIAKDAFTKSVHDITLKTDNSYVSEVDTSIEKRLIAYIQQKYSDTHIVSEEIGEVGNESATCWFLDPLDGTSNFLMGIPLFGTMIALTQQNKLNLAAVCMPVLQMTFAASINQATTLNGAKVSLGSAPLKQTTLIIDSGKTVSGKTWVDAFLTKYSTHVRSIRRPGCVASHLIPLCSQQPFASVIIDASPHDLYPIALIFKQAGMLVINKHGIPWQPTDADLISIHPGIAKDVQKILKEINEQ